jgi:hypothetical protein
MYSIACRYPIAVEAGTLPGCRPASSIACASSNMPSLTCTRVRVECVQPPARCSQAHAHTTDG